MKRVFIQINLIDDNEDDKELAAYQYNVCQNTSEAEINCEEIGAELINHGFEKVR